MNEIFSTDPGKANPSTNDFLAEMLGRAFSDDDVDDRVKQIIIKTRHPDGRTTESILDVRRRRVAPKAEDADET